MGTEHNIIYTMIKNIIFSIIICTKNREDLLLKSIAALINQTGNIQGPTMEIIIVNGSIGSIERLSRLPIPTNIRIRHKHFYKEGISFARNYGVSLSKGKYICFVDDDTIVDSKWISVLSKSIQKHPTQIVFGEIIPVFEKKVNPITLQSIEDVTPWIFTAVKANNPKSIWPYAVNVCIPKGIFTTYGLFSELFANEEGPVKHPYGEDPEFFARILKKGVRARFEQRLKCDHHLDSNRISLQYLLTRYIDDGRNSVLGYINETKQIHFFKIIKFILHDVVRAIQQNSVLNPYSYLYIVTKTVGEVQMIFYLIRYHAYYHRWLFTLKD